MESAGTSGEQVESCPEMRNWSAAANESHVVSSILVQLFVQKTILYLFTAWGVTKGIHLYFYYLLPILVRIRNFLCGISIYIQ